MEFIVVQALTGLASASSLFIVSAGLTLVFGVTRVVNFAHGSLYMLGAYVGWSLSRQLGFWPAVLLTPLAIGVLGLILERLVLRRIYAAPELFQLLATFGVLLIIQDATLYLWGAEDKLGPRAPGLAGRVQLGPYAVPAYDLALVILGPIVLGGLWLLLRRSRWGVLVRAATADPEMTAALGIRRERLFAGVLALGAGLAGLGGVLQLPRAPASLGMDLNIIADAFVVTVVGGMGSIGGAWLAAVIIGLLHAFGIVLFPGITIVLVFLFMAVVLALRPSGLLGRAEIPHTAHRTALPIRMLTPQGRMMAALAALLLVAAPLALGDYWLALLSEIAIWALLAASLQFLTGLGGLVSFGHAAWFGIGAYAAALLVKNLGLGMLPALVAAPLAAAAGAMLFAVLAGHLRGVYFAMMSLAFAQICFAVAFQWDRVTGGDNGLLGIWPPDWASGAAAFWWLTLTLAGLCLLLLRHAAHAPLGAALRATRDAPLGAAAIGIPVRRQQAFALTLAGAAAGLAGGLHVFLKGSLFPTELAIPVSVDALVIVLLGGIETLGGPLAGAIVYKSVQIGLASATNHWRGLLGLGIVACVLLMPQGLMGTWRQLTSRRA